MDNELIAGIEVVTPSAVEAVTFEEMKPHLRLDDETHKPLVMLLAQIAKDYIEWASGRTLCDTVFRQYHDELPDGETPIELVRGPVKSSGFTLDYLDTVGGAATLVAGTDFIVDNKRTTNEIVPAYGKSWASSRSQRNSVVLTYTAGYGSTAASFPKRFKLLIMMLVAAWFENPEAVTSVPLYAVPCPAGFDTLLTSVREWGF